jgi:N-acetylgalactosamine-N,N'-diacetylbacillosaminyl-diphospho-undecaprenol 4-alpha-N-acetylgalactosaminyltransferase
MIISDKKIKIALVGYRLGVGGAEKVMANLSVFFEKKGIEVHNIIVLNVVSYEFKGKLFNLGLLKSEKNGLFDKLKRLYYLNNYLRQNKFDFIIDFRFRNKPLQELLIAKFLYKSKAIFTVHSYLIDHYMPKSSYLTRFMYQKCYKIVTVTNEIKNLIEKKHALINLQTIYNPINIDQIQTKSNEPFSFQYNYIVAIGQMETNVKQFDVLIEAYSNSSLVTKNIHLILLGEGQQMQRLKAVPVKKNCSELVHFFGHQENPYKFLKNALFFVLSSANEGMPNVLLEALACHTPVISFDCLSGPSEIIIDRYNGLLVENQNIQKLTVAMNLYGIDSELYNFCKANSFDSVQKFILENIGHQWLDLMQIKKI